MNAWPVRPDADHQRARARALGCGLVTVTRALLAHDFVPDRATLVLGTVFAIKMVACVGVAPAAGAFAGHLPRCAVLAGLDAVRALVALCLPFVDAVWQVCVLGFAPDISRT